MLRSTVMNASVCVSVCLSDRMSSEPHARSLPNTLCMLAMSVARSSAGMLTIGRIAYPREGGDGSEQRGRSVIYYCHVVSVIIRPYLRVIDLQQCQSLCCRLSDFQCILLRSKQDDNVLGHNTVWHHDTRVAWHHNTPGSKHHEYLLSRTRSTELFKYQQWSKHTQTIWQNIDNIDKNAHYAQHWDLAHQ